MRVRNNMKKLKVADIDYSNKTIGQRIKIARSFQNINQVELAEKAGLAKSFLSEVESDKKSITAKSLLKICNALGFSPNWILTGWEDWEHEQ
mgnify:FL=1